MILLYKHFVITQLYNIFATTLHYKLSSSLYICVVLTQLCKYFATTLFKKVFVMAQLNNRFVMTQL